MNFIELGSYSYTSTYRYESYEYCSISSLTLPVSRNAAHLRVRATWSDCRHLRICATIQRSALQCRSRRSRWSVPPKLRFLLLFPFEKNPNPNPFLTFQTLLLNTFPGCESMAPMQCGKVAFGVNVDIACPEACGICGDGKVRSLGVQKNTPSVQTDDGTLVRTSTERMLHLCVRVGVYASLNPRYNLRPHEIPHTLFADSQSGQQRGRPSRVGDWRRCGRSVGCAPIWSGPIYDKRSERCIFSEDYGARGTS